MLFYSKAALHRLAVRAVNELIRVFYFPNPQRIQWKSFGCGGRFPELELGGSSADVALLQLDASEILVAEIRTWSAHQISSTHALFLLHAC